MSTGGFWSGLNEAFGMPSAEAAYVKTATYQQSPQYTIASILQGESATAAGRQAVASVMANRAAQGGFEVNSNYPGVLGVALGPNQFQGQSTPDQTSMEIAARLLDGSLPDNTGGATFYANPNARTGPGATTAGWGLALNDQNALKIGGNYFTNNQDGKPFTPDFSGASSGTQIAVSPQGQIAQAGQGVVGGVNQSQRAASQGVGDLASLMSPDYAPPSQFSGAAPDLRQAGIGALGATPGAPPAVPAYAPAPALTPAQAAAAGQVGGNIPAAPGDNRYGGWAAPNIDWANSQYGGAYPTDRPAQIPAALSPTGQPAAYQPYGGPMPTPRPSFAPNVVPGQRDRPGTFGPVAQLQTRLASLGLYGGPIDGIAGPQTQAAIAQTNSIPNTAVAGPAAYTHIANAEAALTPDISGAPSMTTPGSTDFSRRFGPGGYEVPAGLDVGSPLLNTLGPGVDALPVAGGIGLTGSATPGFGIEPQNAYVSGNSALNPDVTVGASMQPSGGIGPSASFALSPAAAAAPAPQSLAAQTLQAELQDQQIMGMGAGIPWQAGAPVAAAPAAPAVGPRPSDFTATGITAMGAPNPSLNYPTVSAYNYGGARPMLGAPVVAGFDPNINAVGGPGGVVTPLPVQQVNPIEQQVGDLQYGAGQFANAIGNAVSGGWNAIFGAPSPASSGLTHYGTSPSLRPIAGGIAPAVFTGAGGMMMPSAPFTSPSSMPQSAIIGFRGFDTGGGSGMLSAPTPGSWGDAFGGGASVASPSGDSFGYSGGYRGGDLGGGAFSGGTGGGSSFVSAGGPGYSTFGGGGGDLAGGGGGITSAFNSGGDMGGWSSSSWGNDNTDSSGGMG